MLKLFNSSGLDLDLCSVPEELAAWTSTLGSREQGGHHEGRSGSVAAALHHAGGELPGH